MRIGLISDTHGLLRPQALAFLQGCRHIVHAGDIGRPEVLDSLARIAPLTAVRGNNDEGPWVADLPAATSVELGGVHVFVLHDVQELDLHPPPAGARVIVCGHSHRARVERSPAGVLLVNPGSAGPRRFKLPVTAAELLVGRGGECRVNIVALGEQAPAQPAQ